jgi:pentatricopeptide repeat protein
MAITRTSVLLARNSMFGIQHQMDMALFSSFNISPCTSSNKVLFSKIDYALASFNAMIGREPLPSIVESNNLLSTVVDVKEYETVVSLSKQMELAGIPHDVCTLYILINCFCHLRCVDSGFPLLGKILKCGFQSGTFTFTTLVNGVCKEGILYQAVKLVNEMLAKGYRLNSYTYSTIVNSLCKVGKITEADGLLGKMKSVGCVPDVVAYNSLMNGFVSRGQMDEAKKKKKYLV